MVLFELDISRQTYQAQILNLKSNKNLFLRYGVNPKVKVLNVPIIENAGELIQGLGTSYANRSAAFFQLNEFHLCLVDIENALKNGYPCTLRHKLVERKLACLFRLGNYEKVAETISEEIALDLEIFKQYTKNIEDLMRKQKNQCLETGTDTGVKKCDEEVKKYLDSHISITYAIPEDEKNAKLECASRDICIEYGVEKGFYIEYVVFR